MKVNLKGNVSELTDRDFNNLAAASAAIADAADDLVAVLTTMLTNKAREREAYLDRLIRFCHSGCVED